MAYGTPQVPTLTETFDAFRSRMNEIDTLIATDGGRIVGAASLRTTGGRAELERFMVAPDQRHHGLGSNLVMAIGQHARTMGHTSLSAIVGDREPRLLAFYTSLGFGYVGTTPATDDTPELLTLEVAL